MNAISLDSAIIVTEISKRTLWRRLTEGQITRLANDDRGRAMLAFDNIVPLICVPVVLEDHELFINADAGDADAQNDLAQLFLEVGKPGIAVYWLQAAVDQEHPDAMHNLAQIFIKGTGVLQDDNTGLMWLAKAAAHGHVIAKRQMAHLVPGSGRRG
ncbi:MAG: tetratricopeptide repeat protein [Pseudomonas profundi]|uniref:tetratricopeptide repeat protein n=1 Tax=Pseudomonas profundi TaxID=1981513 RepID=UPI0030029C3D